MMVWRISRRVMATVIRFAFWRPIITLAMAIVVLGAVGLVGMLITGVGTVQSTPAKAGSPVVAALSTTPVAQVSAASANVAPSAAVEQYLKGMTTFNAQLMWNSLSSPAIQAMTANGGTLQSLQQRLDQTKATGARYEEVSFVGGYPLKNGDRYLFYVVSRRGFTAPNQYEQIYFVFTIGQDGKILEIH